MRVITNRLWKISLVWMTLVIIGVGKAEAQQPKLLWKKDLKFKVTSIGFARGSGDVIASGKHDGLMMLIEKNGDTIYQWGPREDRTPHEVGISGDGGYFIYATSWTQSFKEKMKKEDWDERLHYVRRRGSKDLWSKPFPLNNCTKAILSPNARYIAFAGITAEGCCVELWDSAGKKLWIRDSPGIESFEFSPDSKFLVADWGGVVELIDLAGKAIFKEYGGHVVTSVANDASYISTFQGSSDRGVRLLDKRGNIVLKGGPDDLTLVSGDGAKGVLWDKDGAKIYSLPNKMLIKTYPIRPESLQTYFFPAAISHNGRYLVLAGSKISPASQNNIFVVDLSEDKVWETRINEPKLLKVYITNDGKYFLVKTDGGPPGIESRLFYYQIF